MDRFFGAMSFAQHLGQKALFAHLTCRDEWVKNTLEAFEMQCEKAAEWGKCCVEMTVQPSVHMDDEAVELLEKRLGEFGFSSYATRYSKAGNVVIGAAWMPGTETIQKADDGPQGIKANCPVCHENGYVVALMPCGHTVCKQCHPGLCQCPMCRKSLTGATQALFMG